MNDILSSHYGLPGIVIAAMATYVVMIERRHTKERKEWKETIERQFDEANKTTRENTSVLSALKTIIETMRR